LSDSESRGGYELEKVERYHVESDPKKETNVLVQKLLEVKVELDGADRVSDK